MRTRIISLFSAILALITFVLVAGIIHAWTLKPGQLICNRPSIRWQSPALEGHSANKHTVEVTDAVFELVNTGGTPVRVLSTESGCGCTVPSVKPSLVQPGKRCKVEVRATPFFVGEKTVGIVVNTDSLRTPRIPLKITMVGGRKPPFLLRTSGDLYFQLDPTGENSSKELEVVTVQRKSDDKEPLLQIHLNGLRIEPKATRLDPYAIDEIFYKTYTYNVLVSHPLLGRYASGEIVVLDPWDLGYKKTVVVRATENPEFQAIPSRIIHNVASYSDNGATSTFQVLYRGAEGKIRADLVVEGDGLDVQIQRTQASDRVICTVRLKANSEEVIGNRVIHVKNAASGVLLLEVPVSIRTQ